MTSASEEKFQPLIERFHDGLVQTIEDDQSNFVDMLKNNLQYQFEAYSEALEAARTSNSETVGELEAAYFEKVFLLERRIDSINGRRGIPACGEKLGASWVGKRLHCCSRLVTGVSVRTHCCGNEYFCDKSARCLSAWRLVMDVKVKTCLDITLLMFLVLWPAVDTLNGYFYYQEAAIPSISAPYKALGFIGIVLMLLVYHPWRFFRLLIMIALVVVSICYQMIVYGAVTESITWAVRGLLTLALLFYLIGESAKGGFWSRRKIASLMLLSLLLWRRMLL